MNLNLQNQTALITGASQGIGREIAMQLAKQGAQLVITSNDAKKLELVANEIRDFNDKVLTLSGDVTIEEDINYICTEAIKFSGSIDILINNVGGIGRLSQFEDIDNDEWYYLFKLNVMSGVSFSRRLIPQMRKKQRGRIIFIASEKAIEPGRNMSHYAMTKAAVLSIAKSLANELGKDGITVNCVSPGVILTPSWDNSAREANLPTEEYASQFCRNVFANKSLGKPEDVAQLICFLSSDLAQWITGSNFRIDGGSLKNIQI